ncbi:uncharacterized protein Dyak_GE27611 [Drosophila yakuba]|uniref:Uncharacterized protein n=1 Tax=Drosophila yakuba TaxID=7245 RepID=A0A0R1ECG0_DROYA|nr:uncharacterized protein Dyak_GE27611 [Drosophila yakuba]
MSSLSIALLAVLLVSVNCVSKCSNETKKLEAVPLTGHQFVNRNGNTTILHEVQKTETELPLLLNTHEVLPLKPPKKKPYLPLEKIIPTIEYVKPPQPLKEFELHPVTFDFNLGDLEDLEHEVIKKGDLNNQEQRVLALDTSYNPSNPDENDTVDVDIAELSTEPATGTLPGTTTTLSSMTSSTSSTHILKILGSKPPMAPKLSRDLLKQSGDDEMQLKTLGSTINSIHRYLGTNANGTGNGSAVESLYGQANYFQLVANLYDHFYWQISEIRTNVRTGCGLEMQAYLTALHSSYEWAQKGKSLHKSIHCLISNLIPI